MRNTVTVFILVLAAASVFAQQSEVRQVGPFKGVRTGEAISVTLKKGDKESVKIEVEGVDLKSVITDVSGNYLRIHMADGSYKNKNRKVRAEVTYVTLEKVSASSASSVVSSGTIKASNLSVSASSAASIELTVDADRVTVEASSAGDIILEGKAKEMSIDASSAGVVDAYNAECESVDASAGSAGTIKVSVTRELHAEASSAGSIRYRGSPSKSDTRASSGGSVRKTN